MSSEILEQTGSLARQTATHAVWMQWSSLGAGTLTGGGSTAQSIIDPEALVLASLAMLDEERRLADILAWWARVGSRLLSVQRMKVVARIYPAEIQGRLGQFAQSAVAAKDTRWKRYATGKPLETRKRADKESVAPDLSLPPALLLRLRAGFGVSAKPDMLAFLMGIDERAATVQEITRATGYSGVTIRDAARDLMLARFIRETDEHPLRYYARHAQWTTLLEPGTSGKPPDMLHWDFWKNTFAFLTHVNELVRSCTAESASEYVQSSRARDVFLSHRGVFTDKRINVPDPGDFRGAAYLTGFQCAVQALTDFVKKSL